MYTICLWYMKAFFFLLQQLSLFSCFLAIAEALWHLYVLSTNLSVHSNGKMGNCLF